MAYPQHWLFTMGGSLEGVGVEIWQCGIRGAYIPAADGTPDKWLAAVSAPLRAWFSDQSNFMRQDALLQYVKLNQIGADGQYVDPNNPHNLNIPATAGGRVPMMPGFTSVATSWRTTSPNRFALNGRIYPPNTITSAPGNARISNSDRQGVAQAGVALIQLLRTEESENDHGTFRAQVVSNHGGEAYPITRVRVGDVIDVQRRRKNQIREQYATIDVPAP